MKRQFTFLTTITAVVISTSAYAQISCGPGIILRNSPATNLSVGIGLNQPTAALHIKGGTRLGMLPPNIKLDRNDGTNQGGLLTIGITSNAFPGVPLGGGTANFVLTDPYGNSPAGDMAFSTNSKLPQLVIKHNGIVGINTATPNQPYAWQNIKLHLNGDMRFEKGGGISGYATGTTSGNTFNIAAVDGGWSGSAIELHGNNSTDKAGNATIWSSVTNSNPNGGVFFSTADYTNPTAPKWTHNMGVYNNGKVGIGIVNNWGGMPGNYRLYVKDGILTEKVKVALNSTANWSDYVFAADYQLRSLKEVEVFIKANKHLPGVPSAAQLVKEGGIDVNSMFAKQMEKIEELTLYLIELKKENEDIKRKLISMNQ